MTSIAHPDALPKGHRVQEFELLSVLGVGGFGITYLAKDTLLDRTVAIKEYFPRDFAVRTEDHSVHPRSQPESEDYTWGLKRFRDEAKTLARLNHPCIIRIYKYFEAYGSGYIVMEYVEGETLGERLKHENIMSELRLMNILNPLVEGLEQVHAAGYLHRDITPKNILLRKDDTPVLIDFGAARQAIGARSRSVTAIVTPGYAPLEQYSTRGRQQGPWTDIYGLSAVAYRCITGATPKDATERAQGEALISASELAEGQYAKGLLTAIDRGLNIKAEDRPQDLKAWCSLWEQKEKQQTIATEAKKQEVKQGEKKEISHADSGANKTLWRNKKVLISVVVGVVALSMIGLYTFQTEQIERAERKAAEEKAAAARKAAEMKARAEREKAERKAAEERAAAAKKAAEMKARAEREKAARKAAEERAAAARKAAEMKARAEREKAERKAAEERAAAARKAAEMKARAEREKAERKAAEEKMAAARKALAARMKALELGRRYVKGDGVPQDYAEALKWFRLDAEQGDAEAQYNLGFMYENGEGVPQDYAEAVRWYRMAAEQGHANAQSSLGSMYYYGKGIPKDSAEALKWFRLAAKQEDTRGQYNLGWMYENGQGVPQDYAKAVKWYRMAAEQESARAQYNLGMMYTNGQGIPQDNAEAFKWFRMAAEQGVARAQYNLGMMYHNGQGVPQNYAEAVKWYRIAAEQGEALAQRNLGVMYASGQGILQDYVEAHKWLNLAVSGLPSDSSDLLNLVRVYRDKIEEKMTRGEIATAQRLARKWKPKTWGQLKME